MAAPLKYTDDQFLQAKKLVDDGATVADATGTAGIPVSVYYRRLRKPDPPPGGRKRTRAQKVEVSDDDLRSTFTLIASAPAIPMAAWVHCDYCAMHFAVQGPKAAEQLTALSADNPALRKVMVVIHTYLSELAWAGILGMYLGVPVLHHVAPDKVYNFVQPVLRMPPRHGPASPHAHARAPGEPPGNGFAGMDTDSLMRMAESMGMKIDPTVMMGEDAAEPTAEPESPTPAPPAAGGETAPAPSNTDAAE